MITKEDIPSSGEFMLPILRAIEALGGSAQSRQLSDATIKLLDPPEDLLRITYDARDTSVYRERVQWARVDCMLLGALDSPREGLFVLTALGRELLAMPEDEAVPKLRDLRRQTEAAARARRATKTAGAVEEVEQQVAPEGRNESTEWRQTLLRRLHEMSPTAFERFVLYLLRSFNLELEHTGGTGDEGIDGIGIAPISPVLSAKVAVQVKRYKPHSSAGIGRQEVALFQRDAEVAGAERAIMVTLGRYTAAARNAAAATTPMVDLIDGEKLCDLIREKEVGIRIVPQVDSEFFDRFESVG